MISLFFLVSGCATMPHNHDPQSWIFKINDIPVSREEFVYNLHKNDYSKDSLYTHKGIDDYLQLYINFKLKVNEAISLGLDTTRSFIDEFNKYKDQLTESYLKDDSVTDSLVIQAYNRMQLEVNVSHILIKVNNFSDPEDTLNAYNKINRIYRKAVAGEDFDELALRYSEDPSVRLNHGHLGYFTGLQMVYPFENAAYSTPVGEVSMPFRSRFGYHILKVNDIRPASGKVQVAHIMLRFSNNMSAMDSVKIHDRIYSVYNSLMQGGAWDTLCREFSEDQNTRNNEGILQPFSVGQVFPEFAEAAFKLNRPGEISSPVMSPYGWHIIKLIKKIPLASFETLKPELTQKVQHDSRSALAREILVKKLKKANRFKLNGEIFEELQNRADSSLLNASWKYDSLDRLINDVLFTIMDTEYPVKDFYEYASSIRKVQEKTTPSMYMHDLLNEYIDLENIDYEKTHLADKYPDYRMLVREYRDGILLFDLMDSMVWSKAVKDSTGLTKYFSQHRDQYRWGTRIQATIFKADNQETINKVRALLKMPYYALMNDPLKLNLTTEGTTRNDQEYQIDSLYKIASGNENYFLLIAGDNAVTRGSPWDKFIKRHQYDSTCFKYSDTRQDNISLTLVSTAKKDLNHSINDKSAVNLQIESGLYEKGDREFLDMLTWTPGTYDLSIEENEYLVVIEKVLPVQDKQLNEVRGKVISDFQNYLDKSWIQKLRNTYNVTVNKKTLKGIYYQFEAI